MSEPIPLRADPLQRDNSPAARAQRAQAAAEALAREAVDELLSAYQIALAHAEAVADIGVIPPGQRDLAKRFADVLRGEIDKMKVLRERRP